MFSYRIQHKDGSWLYFESLGTNLMHNPLVAGFVINSRDVTDRKKEEEEKRQKEVAALKFNIEREKSQLEKENAEREKS
jgi:PAS domain-containing protein